MLLGRIMGLLLLLILGYDAECSTCEHGLLFVSEASNPRVPCCAEIMAWVSAPTAWLWAATAW